MDDLFAGLTGTSTSSSGVHHVPTSAPPTTEAKASTGTSRGYTLRPSGSPTRYDLAGAALRTAIGSEFAALTGCAPRWKVRATPAGRSWSLLDMPVRRTSEDDPGLLLPTPSAQDYGTNQGGAAGRSGKVRPSLKTMLTPTSTDNLDCPSMQKWAGARELRALLDRCMSAPLPTCTASLGGVESDGKTGRKLVTILAGLATPPVPGGRSGKASEATFARGSRPLNEQLDASGITQERVLLAIYAWMMGFPPGWHASGEAPTETLSSSPSSPPSSEESCASISKD